MFKFSGNIESSKSILNRLQIVRSYFPDLVIVGNSRCDDVVHLRRALEQLSSGDCFAGDGGTTFRFLVLRAARVPQVTTIRASLQLLRRPQQELLNICSQLGVEIEQLPDRWIVHGKEWQSLPELKVDVSTSTQFVSAILLNAWLLPFDFKIKMTGQMVSKPYFTMTLEILRELGMNINVSEGEVFIPQGQYLTNNRYQAEPDISSSFAIAALAAVGGHCWIKNFPNRSLQPDMAFLKAFQKMEVPFELDEDGLRVFSAEKLKPLNMNLSECPDLFPVLAAVCAFADGTSEIRGAPHLKHKESDRIQATSELLNAVSAKFEVCSDGLKVLGPIKASDMMKEIEFNPRGDHRLVMAAQLLKQQGFNIKILDPECVKKSFADYWEIIEGRS